jgi:hypothetical protein
VGTWSFGGILVLTLVVVSLMALTLSSIVSDIVGASGDRSAKASTQYGGTSGSRAGNCEISVTSSLTVVENT